MTLQIHQQDEITKELVAIAIARHPTPWRVERDWGYEVRDSKGDRVGLFRTEELAEAMVKLSEQYIEDEKALVDILREDFNNWMRPYQQEMVVRDVVRNS